MTNEINNVSGSNKTKIDTKERAVFYINVRNAPFNKIEDILNEYKERVKVAFPELNVLYIPVKGNEATRLQLLP